MPTTINGNKVSVALPAGDVKRQTATDVGVYPLQNVTLAQALVALNAVTDLPTAKTYLGHVTRKALQMDADIKELQAQVATLLKK